MRIAFNASFARKLLASTAMIGALSFGAAAISGSAQAEEMMSAGERAAEEARLEQLRLAALAEPDNMQIQFSRAMSAKKLGYTDEAIRVLASMTAKQDGLSRAELELAALYFASGDYEKARPHFVAAQNSPKATTELKERIAVYLEAIDNRLRTSVTMGTLVVGLGYQTNANAGSDDFADTLNSGQVAEQDDFNLFASLGVAHNRKVGPSNRAIWETNAKVYGSFQLDVDQVSLGYAEVASGVKFGLANEMPMSLNLKPYVKLGYLFLEDSTFFIAPSAGAVMNATVGSGVLGVGYEYTRQSYSDSDSHPRAEERDADDHEITISYALNATAQDSLSFALKANMVDATTDFWTYDGYEAEVRYTRAFSETFVPGTLPGSLTLGLKYGTNEYDATDPAVAALVGSTAAREDDRLIVDASALLPLSDTMGISLAANYTDQSSNVALFDYDNLRVLAGVAIGF